MQPYDMETIEVNGHLFQVERFYDEDHGSPWENYDGHGVIRETRTSSSTGRVVKRPGERVLHQDGGNVVLYDVQATLRVATRDEWGCVDGRQAGETVRAYRARAVEADYDYLRRWCREDWCYIGLRVTLLDDDETPIVDASESLWGIESIDESQILEAAHELADNVITDRRETWQTAWSDTQEAGL